jgi:hypothetical protein
MNGSLYTVVAAGAALVLTPLILDVDTSGATNETIATILSPFGDILGLVFVLVVTGALIALWQASFQ